MQIELDIAVATCPNDPLDRFLGKRCATEIGVQNDSRRIDHLLDHRSPFSRLLESDGLDDHLSPVFWSRE